jgi:xylulose-5-phosphate/fructose-6-phosphate phosphoketolase
MRQSTAVRLREFVASKLAEHKRHIERYGEDLPEIRNWRWQD